MHQIYETNKIKESNAQDFETYKHKTDDGWLYNRQLPTSLFQVTNISVQILINQDYNADGGADWSVTESRQTVYHSLGFMTSPRLIVIAVHIAKPENLILINFQTKSKANETARSVV